ncbi:MAG: hypothetical protein IJ565_00195 [Bacilli bacterium]|nr:hypothetical protein [Bacilli bacterium]
MDNYKFIDIARRIADTIPTRYQLGGWGQQQDGYYLFDCVCLIKSILWGFDFQVGGHGGAVYLANGVPDVGANRMIELCTNISEDFNNIEIGEILWLDGHVGIYVGERFVVEATAAWENKVLVSYVETNGVRIRNGHQVYRWVKHGRLPYITYNSGYATITNLAVEDITTTSVKIIYTVDLPITEVLYSLDNRNYVNLPIDGIISGLLPNTKYEVKIKVKREYTNNYTEKSISFTTLDEPISLKYSIGNVVEVDGALYDEPTSNNELMVLSNYKATITDTNNHYGVLHPYKIDELGWTNENNIKLYEEPQTDIFEIIKNILKLILKYVFIPLGIILLVSILIIVLIIKSILF